MKPQVDYLTNIKLSDNDTRTREALKMQQHFGYLPVYGPTMSDVITGKNLLTHILRVYPGYRWVLEVRDTIITVFNETLDQNWGFRLREGMLDSDGKVIVRFCGELLERYKLARGAKNQADVDALPGIGRGNKKRIGE